MAFRKMLRSGSVVLKRPQRASKLALKGLEETRGDAAWTAQSTGLMSTTGVPSMTSMGPMRSRFLASSRTVT